MQPPAQRPAGGPLAPIALSGLFRLLAATWRVRFQGRGLLLEIMDRGPSVLAFWHGEQLAMIAAHQRLGILSMISRSRDGELVGRVVAGLGFGVVRGSSSRGGGEALQGCAAAMRARGAALGPPDARAWIPSALWPWRYYGCAREGGAVRLLTADARRGEVFEVGRAPVLDGDWADALAAAPEFALMRALSPAYHVVEARAEGDGTYLAARDLRTRNFGTRFGALELWLDAGRQIRRRRWHV